MPEMNGIEFLRERKRQGIEIPVIILSSIAERGAAITMEALALGASDFVQKPSGSISTDIHTVQDQVTHLLLAYGGAYARTKGRLAPALPVDAAKKPDTAIRNLSTMLGTAPPTQAKAVTPIRKPATTEIIAIGISTGGPDALRVVFAGLDADLKPPILVVQHMPAGFTTEFARSLDRICPLSVSEAEDGEVIEGGHIYIAPGGTRHLQVERKLNAGILHLVEEPPVSGHRPSADVLFASVAMAYTNHALGVIMTGMGGDGAKQMGTIYREGGITLGQDEASAVVYGMPRVAFELGNVMEQVSLQKMAGRISAVAKTPR
jgi:two-component system chemotaxis response regulator CheB